MKKKKWYREDWKELFVIAFIYFAAIMGGTVCGGYLATKFPINKKVPDDLVYATFEGEVNWEKFNKQDQVLFNKAIRLHDWKTQEEIFAKYLKIQHPDFKPKGAAYGQLLGR